MKNPEARARNARAKLENQSARRGECLIWIGKTNRNGYGKLRHGREQLAHRVAWTLANGPIPEGLCVCHRCDTPACVEPSHLFLGTFDANNKDRARKGRSARRFGEQHHRSKLSDEDRAEMTALAASRALPQREIANRFGVSRYTVQVSLYGRCGRGQLAFRWSSEAA